MIQDIYPHSLKIEYDPDAAPDPDSIVMCFSGRELLCRSDEDGTVEFPCFRDISAACGSADTSSADPQTGVILGQKNTDPGDLIYLFRLDDRKFFLYPSENVPDAEGFELKSADLFRSARPKELGLATVTAYHLSVWYRSNRYCGCCGRPTVRDSKERMLRCPECGNTVFPKIMPSVIVGVINGDKILLTRYNRPGAKLSALVAGFTEIGETAEQTVEREVLEEVGLKVGNIRYYKSQPWGITGGGLLLGFWCDVVGDPTVRADGTELAEAAWVSRDELLADFTDPGIALTAEMIMTFARGDSTFR